jgi:serine protease inhibitor
MKTRTSIIFIIFLFFININIISAINSVRRTEKKALTLSSVVNGFSFKLLRAITKDTTNRQKNVVASPLNAAFALGILNDGADGRTRGEIDSILGCENTIFDSISHRLLENFDGVETSYTKKTNMEGFLSGLLLKQNQDSLNKSLKSLHRMSHEYQRVDTLAQVFMNNGIVVNSKYQLKKSYVDKISKTYSATTKIFDFMLPEAKECVNCWYSEKTSNMIPQVVDKITPNDCLYSVNSIYFKGKWSRMFTEENTKYADFEKDNGAKTQIKVINYLDFCLYNN